MNQQQPPAPSSHYEAYAIENHPQQLDPPPAAGNYDPTALLEEHLQAFWERNIRSAEEDVPDFKHPTLPLARIKKVMKSDPEVKMIGSDAPILFAKACEVFIAELTSRAWLVASAHKRRTLSRADIAKAIAKSDQFDFLIDIVPREIANEKGRSGASRAARRQLSTEGTYDAGEDMVDDEGEGDAEGDAEDGDGDDGEGATTTNEMEEADVRHSAPGT